MNTIVLFFAAILVVAHGGDITQHAVVAPLAKTTLLQGPSASATVVGNNGSAIVAHAPGARIVATEHVGGIAESYSAPAVIAHTAPVVAHAAPAVVSAYSAPAVVAPAAVAVALAGARTTHLQGPSASATVIGNDGQGIVAHAPGGSIVATEQVGGASVGYSAPVVAHHGINAYAAPAVVAHHGINAYAAPAVVAHHEINAYAARAVVGQYGIATYAAPAVVGQYGINAYAAPAFVSHHGISAYARHAGLVHAYAAGSGIEGQYVPDYTEKLYDDGSYKGEYYH